jgi:antitoxin FitA
LAVASITIRNLDESIIRRLRVRAARHKRSMEDEARQILAAALTGEHRAEHNLAVAIQNRFKAFGGIELRLPLRQSVRKPRRA